MLPNIIECKGVVIDIDEDEGEYVWNAFDGTKFVDGSLYMPSLLEAQQDALAWLGKYIEAKEQAAWDASPEGARLLASESKHERGLQRTFDGDR